jgi:dTDP-4-dehydrorhamnose 3,5-epimerase-like enzyme
VARRVETSLEGVFVVEPEVHGDERGFLVETFREDAWRDLGVEVELDDRAQRQLFIPAGFAHGFCVLSETADVAYKLSSYFDPATEAGFAWDDPEVGIEWPISDPILSERDRTAPRLTEIADSLPW